MGDPPDSVPVLTERPRSEGVSAITSKPSTALSSATSWAWREGDGDNLEHVERISDGGDAIAVGMLALSRLATGRLQRTMSAAPQLPTTPHRGRKHNRAIHVAGRTQRWWRRSSGSLFVVAPLTDKEQMEKVREQYRRNRYWEPLEWPRVAQAVYVIVFPAGAGLGVSERHGTLALKIVFYVVAGYTGLYNLAYLWSRRPTSGRIYKAFIYQEGLVHSRMQEAYVWTWLGFIVVMCYNVYSLGTMFFRFMGEQHFYGSRACLVLLFFSSMFPLILGHDPVTCSTIFKEAAAHFGYPGMMSLHRGYWFHVIFDVATVVCIVPLWMFFCGPASFYAQYSFDFYILYFLAGMSLLVQLYLFPRYARIVNKLETKATPIITDSSTVGGQALLRTKSALMHKPAVTFSPDFSLRGSSNLHSVSSAAQKPPGGFRPSLGDDGCDRGTCPRPGCADSSLRSLPSGYRRVTITPAELQRPSRLSFVQVRRRNSLTHSGDDEGQGDIPAASFGRESQAARSVSSAVQVIAYGSDIPVRNHSLRPRRSSESLSRTGSMIKPAPVATLSALRSGAAQGSFVPDGQRRSFSGRDFFVNGSHQIRRTISTMSITSAAGSVMAKLQPSASFLRHTEGNFMESLQISLRGLPQSAPAMAKNVSRSVAILLKQWRFMAACRPEKFTYAAGVILPSLFLWPVWEIMVPYHNIPLAILVTAPKAVAVLIGLLVAFYLLSSSTRCSEAMILAAAAANQGIGSGLVYSTAGVLTALLTGKPLKAGTVATEERIREAAAVSCRWDISCCWTLLVQEGSGTRECSIMMPRVQLFRAAIEARRRGCKWFWMDTLSIPQSSEKDSGELRAQKAAVCQRLITTMTSVYACCKRVIVVETQAGMTHFDTDHYCCRTWTLQECVLNKSLSEVPLIGEVQDRQDAESRSHLTGTTEEDTWVVDNNLSNLETYEWVLRGRVTSVASKVSADKAAQYLRFVERRYGACAADKAVALGQIFFKVLFENPEVSSQFMQELACTLAETQADGLGASTEPLLLIDNSDWDIATMTGSASMPRFLAGKPGSIQDGDSVMWTVMRLRDSAPSTVAEVVSQPGSIKMLDDPHSPAAWWMCWMALRSRIIPVAIEQKHIRHGPHRGKSLLLKLRTCTPEEKQRLEDNVHNLAETRIVWL